MNVTERINRVLFILSYVSQHPGVQVEALAEQVGLKPRELLKELDFILLIGKPPFQPDDYIDIYVEDDRVFVEFDQMLNRPLRFTHPEAIALLMSLQLLDPELEPKTVRSLEKTIGAAIRQSVDVPGRVQGQIAIEQASSPVTQHFSRLRRAVESNRKVRIDYYSLTRNEKGRRTVRPYFLTKSLGYWYLTGYCELRQDLRTFKFERILAVRLLSEVFPPPQDIDVERYQGEFLKLMGKQQVEIHFDAEVAPWIREQWGDAVADDPDGGVLLRIFSDTLEFPSRLVLGHAPHARPIRPAALIEQVREDAKAIVSLYETQKLARD